MLYLFNFTIFCSMCVKSQFSKFLDFLCVWVCLGCLICVLRILTLPVFDKRVHFFIWKRPSEQNAGHNAVRVATYLPNSIV